MNPPTMLIGMKRGSRWRGKESGIGQGSPKERAPSSFNESTLGIASQHGEVFLRLLRDRCPRGHLEQSFPVLGRQMVFPELEVGNAEIEPRAVVLRIVAQRALEQSDRALQVLHSIKNEPQIVTGVRKLRLEANRLFDFS